LTPGYKKVSGKVPADSLPMRILWKSLCKTYKIEKGKAFIERVFPQDLIGGIRKRCG
jgi:hypothetical protein